MITGFSILPLIGAVLSAGLLTTTILMNSGSMNRLRWSFVGMNAFIVLWCAGYIAQQQPGGGVSSEAASFGTIEYWLFVFVVAGFSGTSTYWFAFAAALTRRSVFTPVLIPTWHLPFAANVTVAITNPWHLLYAAPGPDGRILYAPLTAPAYLSLYVLVFTGL